MSWLELDAELLRTPRIRLALVLVAIGALLFVVAVYRAIGIDAVSDTAPSSTARAVSNLSIASAVQIDPEAVVETDIFSADRLPPSARYPMPGESRTRAVVAVVPPPPPPLVLGTAVSLDGSAFATAQLPNNPPRIVRVGDKLGVFTVVAISRGTVTFRVAGDAPFQVNAP